MSDMRLQEAIVNDVIFHLDVAQDERVLSDAELNLRRLLKARLLALATIDRARWRQKSRLTTIRTSDANTKLFHLRANWRCRKNHIPTLKK